MQKNKKQITYLLPFYGLMILSFFPLLNIKGVSISIIILSFFSVTYLFSDFKNRWSPNLNNFLYTSIPFSLYLLGLFYTSNFHQALKTLETGLPLLLFPLIYFIILGEKYIIDEQMKNKLLNGFILSGSILIIFVFYYIFYSGAWHSFFDEDVYLKTTENRGRDIIRWTISNTPFFGEHPTYFGLIGIFVSLLSAFSISKNSKKHILSLLLGIAAIIISGSKIVIITFILLTISFVFIYIKVKQNKVKLILGLLILVSVLYMFFPIVKIRFNQVFQTKFEPPKGLRYNSTNVRTAVYICTFENIKKAPLLGFGTGGYREGMINCFKKFDTDIFKKHNYYYNSHNQYLSFILSNGILGLLLFILWLIILFRKAKVYNSQLLFLSTLTFTIIFFTENLLERQTGNVMFSFLIFLLYKFNSQKNVS